MRKFLNPSDNGNHGQINWQGADEQRPRKSKLYNNSSLATAMAAIFGFVFVPSVAHAGINVPTDMTASPLCIAGKCASEFTAKMVMFEEFGLDEIPNSGSNTTTQLPPAVNCQSGPDGEALDEFLSEDLHPMPRRKVEKDDDDYSDLPESPTTLSNAWDAKLRGECASFVGLADTQRTYAEGRPGGEFFAHQRYGEFPPQKYFQSATTGSRINGGLRDDKQLHKYEKGEFGPGGLYYVDADNDQKGGTKGIEIKIHPDLPVQQPNSVWTFDGTLPPKLLMARVGESVLFRHYNALPIDVAANNGFGLHTITTHEHNGHNPAESDGYAHAFFYPGQYYDYLWPMVLAGYDAYPNDPKAGMPDNNGGMITVRGDSRETASTHWFHDHMLDFTAQNVYKGNAAMMNIYSAIDRGREPKDSDEANGVDSSNSGYACNYANPNSPNLCLPSGSELDWGNRDYDVNLLVADKAWDNAGQLKFNIFNFDGFLGDRMTVNWIYKPYMEVRARRYRFRILNGAVSRTMKIAIVNKDGATIPFHMIANDGNIMEHAIPFPNSQAPESLPEQTIAERYDIVVDFKGMAGQEIYFVNLMEHENGKGPSRKISLASVLNGTYKADGKDGDPAVGKFLKLYVKPYSGTDLSMDPVDYEEGKKKMIPLSRPTQTELKTAKHRTFQFDKNDLSDVQPWTIKTDGGVGYTADPHRVSAAPEIGKVEIWHFRSSTSWQHPVHVHFEEGQILYRDGKAPRIWEKYARKDIYRIGGPLPDTSKELDIAIRVRDFAGTYVEHCHNTQHEDHAMLLRWDAFQPGQMTPIPTPEPGWDGAFYSPSITLPSFISGDTSGKVRDFAIPKTLPK